jgi:hypothetical protein
LLLVEVVEVDGRVDSEFEDGSGSAGVMLGGAVAFCVGRILFVLFVRKLFVLVTALAIFFELLTPLTVLVLLELVVGCDCTETATACCVTGDFGVLLASAILVCFAELNLNPLLLVVFCGIGAVCVDGLFVLPGECCTSVDEICCCDVVFLLESEFCKECTFVVAALQLLKLLTNPVSGKPGT